MADRLAELFKPPNMRIAHKLARHHSTAHVTAQTITRVRGARCRVAAQADSGDGPSSSGRPSATATAYNAGAGGSATLSYDLLLALTAKFMQLPDSSQLQKFLKAKPEATSVGFLLWLADKEAKATGQDKEVLANICQQLVLQRELIDDVRLNELYIDTLGLLTAGQPEETALVLANNPEQYAVQLAERLTGAPVRTDGYDPVYDVLLKVAPPAALTPEGVKKGHEQAKELAVDMRDRRRRSVASMIGRAKLTPEQADQLMGGTSAARILDMLLGLPSSSDRISCLPDCFTPPSEADEAQLASETADVLWCTPSQLLNEVDSRLRALSGEGLRPPHSANARAMLPASYSLSGDALIAELRLLREEVGQRWLDSLPAAQQQ